MTTTRYNVANIDTDIFRTFVAQKIKGNIIKPNDFLPLYLEIQNIEKSIDYKMAYSIRDIEIAVCNQFKDGDILLSLTIREGAKKILERKRMLGAIIWFTHCLHSISYEQIGKRYRLTGQVIGKLRKYFLTTMHKDSKVQRLIDDVCKELIQNGVEKIKKMNI